jgi:CDP-diacylglycerol--glycerol-3-phosphate 3-phosphatidyltransferase
MFLLCSKGLLAKSMAFAVFSLACATDFLDGYIARRYGLITNLGKLLDPIADKILVLSAFLAFVEMRIIPAWMVVIIILRELMITGIRVHAANQGKILAASLVGKHKTVSQMVSIFVIVGVMILKEAGVSVFSFWTARMQWWAENSIYALMLVTVGLTLVSGVSYVINNKDVFWNAKTN